MLSCLNMADGIETADTEALLKVRANLWAGLGKVGETIADGTFHVTVGKSASPAQAGWLTLVLFFKTNTELAKRGEEDWTCYLTS